LSRGQRLPADLGWLLGDGNACNESGAYFEASVVDPPASRDFYDVVRSPREKDVHPLSWEELFAVQERQTALGEVDGVDPMPPVRAPQNRQGLAVLESGNRE